MSSRTRETSQEVVECLHEALVTVNCKRGQNVDHLTYITIIYYHNSKRVIDPQIPPRRYSILSNNLNVLTEYQSTTEAS